MSEKETTKNELKEKKTEESMGVEDEIHYLAQRENEIMELAANRLNVFFKSLTRKGRRQLRRERRRRKKRNERKRTIRRRTEENNWH